MLEALKQEVYDANMELWKQGLVIYTWGNVSGIDRSSGLVVIKPSGVDYEKLSPETMTVVDLQGKTVEGAYRPSSDTETHLELYRSFPEIGGIVHTHAVASVAFAQAGLPVPALGTTHADYFYGDIPCTRPLTEAETVSDYERNTGVVIRETLRGTDPIDIPGILVRNHGPFSWGRTPKGAVYHAVVLEKVAEMAYRTLTLNPEAPRAPGYLLDKHYFRKHGSNAYYGQGTGEDH